MAAETGPFLRRRLYGVAGASVLLTGSLVYIGLVDPHKPGALFPQCPFRLLTGWNCPACGGLRMTHDLLHGNLAAACMDNAFLLVGLPALMTWILLQRHRGAPVLPIPAVATLTVAAIAWTVLRNLPGFPLTPTALTG
jgi:hypothetical protein